MIKYLSRRLLGWFVMIVVATNLTYFLASFYLHPRSNYVGRRPPIPDDVITRSLDQYNLNDQVPIISRWWVWLKGIVLDWNWGMSPSGDSVNEQVAFRIWVSAEFILGATILMTVIGIALGVYTASRQYKASDRIAQGTSIITYKAGDTGTDATVHVTVSDAHGCESECSLVVTCVAGGPCVSVDAGGPYQTCIPAGSPPGRRHPSHRRPPTALGTGAG